MHGRDPFRWQARLCRDVLAAGGVWPEVIDLPTGFGKTSVIDVAVYVMSALEPAPYRRIVYVVDRRLVVDEVHAHAGQLAGVLASSEDPAVVLVRQGLLRRAGRLDDPGSRPLAVHRMRGGVHRDERWTEDPAAFVIITSTVDQAGSRLLFRGYGVSSARRPVDAALLGMDALWIVDEAHLVEPLVATIRSVARMQRSVEQSPAQPLSVVCMSATPVTDRRAKVFTLDPAQGDLEDEVLRRRWSTRKAAVLREIRVKGARGKAFTSDVAAELAKEMCQVIHRMLEDGAESVAAVANTTGVARLIFEELRSRLRDAHVVLLTGRVRPWDRDAILKRYEDVFARIRTGTGSPREKTVVVATQTIEVGTDFDFDAMVTQNASLTALVQRFGRVLRGGREQMVPSVVIRVANVEDPVYGDDERVAWETLTSLARDRGRDRTGLEVDFSSEVLRTAISTLPREERRPASVPLLRPHVDALQMTNVPLEIDLSPWLHGSGAGDPDVTVVWRADLEEGKENEWATLVLAMPPCAREGMPVPIRTVRAWLRGGADADAADVESVQAEAQDDGWGRGGRPIVVWRGEDACFVGGVEELAPGDTVVVPASYGGSDEWGWNPQARPVADVAEFAALDALEEASDGTWAPLLRIRLTDGAASVVAPGAEQEFRRARARVLRAHEEDDEDALKEAAEALLGVVDARIAEAADRIRPWRSVVVVGGAVLTLRGARSEDRSQGLVSLEDHQRHVRAVVTRTCDALGVAGELRDALVLAASVHDEGKRHPATQASYGWREGLPALAKSLPGYKRRRAIRDYRHEAVSAAALTASGRASGDGLAVHLAASHHGWARPVVPRHSEPVPVTMHVRIDGEEVTVSSAHGMWRVSSGRAGAFLALARRHGPWGLAWIEAVLRTADWEASGAASEGGAQEDTGQSE